MRSVKYLSIITCYPYLCLVVVAGRVRAFSCLRIRNVCDLHQSGSSLTCSRSRQQRPGGGSELPGGVRVNDACASHANKRAYSQPSANPCARKSQSQSPSSRTQKVNHLVDNTTRINSTSLPRPPWVSRMSLPPPSQHPDHARILSSA